MVLLTLSGKHICGSSSAHNCTRNMHRALGSCVSDGSPSKQMNLTLDMSPQKPKLHLSKADTLHNAFAQRAMDKSNIQNNAFSAAEIGCNSGATHDRSKSESSLRTVETHPMNKSPMRTNSTLEHRMVDTSSTVTTMTGIINAANCTIASTATNEEENAVEKQKHRPRALDLNRVYVPEDLYMPRPTARAEIEAKSEKRLFKMMGQLDTPSDEDTVIVPRFEFKSTEKPKFEDEKNRASTPSRKDKKFLGIAFPSLKNHPTSEPKTCLTPELSPPLDLSHISFNVPPKAAKLIGGTSTTKRIALPKELRQIRSDTGVIKLSTQQHLRSKSKTSRTSKESVQKHQASRSNSHRRPGADEISVPPTPPAKDTPPLPKNTDLICGPARAVTFIENDRNDSRCMV
jgi:hypothetical protein